MAGRKRNAKCQWGHLNQEHDIFKEDFRRPCSKAPQGLECIFPASPPSMNRAYERKLAANGKRDELLKCRLADRILTTCALWNFGFDPLDELGLYTVECSWALKHAIPFHVVRLLAPLNSLSTRPLVTCSLIVNSLDGSRRF